MPTISFQDADSDFGKIIHEVRGGKEFTITDQGRPVAKLAPFEVPPAENSSTEKKASPVERIEEFGERHHLNGMNLMDLVQEGRER